VYCLPIPIGYVVDRAPGFPGEGGRSAGFYYTVCTHADRARGDTRRDRDRRPRRSPPSLSARYASAMSAITQASAQVAKTVAVSTGKVTNAKSMMVWKPHGNKYVFDARRDARERASEGCGIIRRGR
jgi:hypothetical protein